MTGNIRILVADDHPLVRAGIVSTLTAEPGITVVGEATSGDEVLQLARLQPDVVLLDLAMPGVPPAQTIAILARESPATRVLVLTAHDNASYIRQMVSAGAAGYLLKEEALSNVLQAIRTVVAGGKWFSAPVMAKLMREGILEEPQEEDQPFWTHQELELLRLVAENRTDQEIGSALGLAERTVRYHLRAIYDKLGVNSRLEAAVRAVRLGLIAP
jgi:DNA-binding NarL/FixJ family response regulator